MSVKPTTSAKRTVARARRVVESSLPDRSGVSSDTGVATWRLVKVRRRAALWQAAFGVPCFAIGPPRLQRFHAPRRRHETWNERTRRCDMRRGIVRFGAPIFAVLVVYAAAFANEGTVADSVRAQGNRGVSPSPAASPV